MLFWGESVRIATPPTSVFRPQRGGGGRKRPRMPPDKGTTTPGFANPHRQEVIRNTGKAGTDHGQSVYELKCQHCGHSYGSYRNQNIQKKCPHCQSAAESPAPQFEFDKEKESPTD